MIKRVDYIIYIDTLNRRVNPKIAHFLTTQFGNVPVFRNRKIIQYKKSDFCGLMSLLFVLYFNSLEAQTFSLAFEKKNLKKNDLLTVQYINMLLDK